MTAGTCQINWVVALKPEAEAVIQRFSLKPACKGKELFPTYVSDDQQVRLVVTGPGKVSAAAGTAFLAGRAEEANATAVAWINFGIAGTGDSAFGETFLASRVSDETAGRSWYPLSVWPKKADLHRREVVTVDQPAENYPDSGALVEMEAAGFYPVAVRSASVELCQVLKVVSDDPEHPIREIDKALAKRLCENGLDEAEPWLSAFRGILMEEAERLAPPPEFEELLKCFHFTQTRQHQLKRLLQQWHARNPDPDAAILENLRGAKDASSVLSLLRQS